MSYQNRIDEYREVHERDQIDEELSKLNERNYHEHSQADEELDRSQYEAEMERMYGPAYMLDRNQDLTDGCDGYF